MKKLLITALTVLCGMSMQAQDTDHRRCDTDQMWQELISKDPAAKQRHDALRAAAANFNFSKVRADRKAQKSTTAPPLYRIPVVFHVIHTYGPENISKAQIEDAVNILNLSFQKLNPDTGMVIPLFQPIFADCEIEFALATIDPNGNCTDGITRTYSPLTASASDNVKALVGWPSNKYLNIWVVKNIASGAAGYAYYPGANQNIDGVVIRHDYVGSFGTSNGSNYTQRSLTHEVGHWLDLPHTWGSSNTPGLASNCSIDDGISDTPNTIGVDDFSCNTAQNTCGQIDNVQNYMDYASCHYMFTEGQKVRMFVALNNNAGSRDNLWTTNNLLATGTDPSQTAGLCKPQADFEQETVFICQGGSHTFQDISWGGAVANRVWSFPGGTPSTDTSANPVITYANPGVYDVQLIVYNAGGSDTLIRTGYVQVIPNPGTTPIPYSEGFEQMPTLSGAGWSIDNPGANNSFGLFSGAGSTGSYCLRLVNQVGNINGVDRVITPSFYTSNVSAAQMTFKYAYAAKNNNDASVFRVYLSPDCGNSWYPHLSKTGSTLRTASNTSGNYVPGTADWVQQTLNLASTHFSGQSSAIIRFEFTNDQGNNLYIDDINITGVVGTGEELAAMYDFQAFPNPANDRMKISLQSGLPADVRLELTDMAGRLIEVRDMAKAAGQIVTEFDGTHLSGLYLLRITVNGTTFTRRIAFAH